ncbi:hypothetical protein [Pseudonocardia spinosispora]|uniref:hypothetical protein n=1 Tax=Pseudonocardia spinosispora TaxID=103441 RepID=UPI0004112E31|nr:hypothetical protein [Pseudonocardia spinosispora]
MSTPPPYPGPDPSGQEEPQPGFPGAGNYPNYPGSGPRFPDDPLVPLDFAGWFRRSIDVARRSAVTLGILQLISAVVSVVVSIATAGPATAFLDQATALQASAETGAPPDMTTFGAAFGAYAVTMLISWVISIAVTVFVMGASLFVAIRDADGNPATAADGLRFAAKRAPLFAAWLALAWILIGIGTVFFFIPGIYLAVVLLSSLAGVVVVERNGIGRCFDIIRGRFWATTGRMLVALLLVGVYAFIVYGISGALGGGPTSVSTALLHAVLAIPASIVVVGIATVTYAELRFHQDNRVTTGTLAAEMQR